MSITKNTVNDLVDKGWQVMGLEKRDLPPSGVTGANNDWQNGYYPTSDGRPNYLAVRYSPNTCGLDIDTDPRSHDWNDDSKALAELWAEFLARFSIDQVRTGANTENYAGVYHFRLDEGMTEYHVAKVRIKKLDVLRKSHRYAVVAGVHEGTGNEYMGADDLPRTDDLPVLTWDALNWLLDRSAKRKAYDSTDEIRPEGMPPLVRPLTAELDIYGWYGEDAAEYAKPEFWAKTGGRKAALFGLICHWFYLGLGLNTPERAMGKALWVAREVMEYIDSDKKRWRSIEDFWNDNKLGEVLAKGKDDGIRGEGVPMRENTSPKRSSLQVISLADERVERLEFLWEQRIVNGVASLMPAKQGMGKSTVSIDLAASLSRGALPGKYFGTPRSTFILAAEDDERRVIRPRALVNGFDFKNADLRLVNYSLGDDGSLNLPNLKFVLDELPNETGFEESALIIVDTPVRFIAAEGDAATNSYSNVMMLMLELNSWAKRYDKTVLLLWHLNKEGETMGSAGWEAGVRNVIKLEEDPDSTDENMTGLLYVSKMNGAPISAPPLRYILTNTYGQDDNGVSYAAAKVIWSEAYESKREMFDELKARKDGRSTVDTDIVNYLRENGVTERTELMDEITFAQSTITAGLKRLVDAKKIYKSNKEFGGTVKYSLTPFTENEAPVEDYAEYERELKEISEMDRIGADVTWN